MGHTPYGYRIEGGTPVIDEEASRKIRKLYENYLSGLGLKNAAAKAGIVTYHGTAKRLLQTRHYIGDDFYPAIIDEVIFQKAQDELARRAAALGRANYSPKEKQAVPPTSFTIGRITKHYDSPAEMAEYIYSLIESEEH